MRLIDADALMKDLEKWMKQVDPTHPQEDNAIPPMEDIIVSTLMTIEEQPTIERKTGKWIRLTNDLAQCSECKDYIDNAISGGYNYCPNCGARVDGEQDE